MPAAKITEEITGCIVDALGAGHYREVACKLAGIDRKTLLNWCDRKIRISQKRKIRITQG